MKKPCLGLTLLSFFMFVIIASMVFAVKPVRSQSLTDNILNGLNNQADETGQILASPSILATSDEICGDGIDNNGNGAIDEEPCQIPPPAPGQQPPPAATSDEICGDGIDNNGNGAIDEEPCPQPTEETDDLSITSQCPSDTVFNPTTGQCELVNPEDQEQSQTEEPAQSQVEEQGQDSSEVDSSEGDDGQSQDEKSDESSEKEDSENNGGDSEG